jgi:hypothetical protein
MGIFSFFWKGLKENLNTIKIVCQKMKKGESIIKGTKLEQELKNFNFKTFLKENWIEFVIYILIFILGIRWGMWSMAQTCNNFILENYVQSNLPSGDIFPWVIK